MPTFLALLLCVFFFFCDAAFAAGAPGKIVITPASFSEREGLLIVSQNQGFFRKHKLDVELVLMPSAPIAFSALAAGESHFYYGHTKRIYPTVDDIRNSIRVLTLTNEKFRALKAEDLVDDRIIWKLEKDGAFPSEWAREFVRSKERPSRVFCLLRLQQTYAASPRSPPWLQCKPWTIVPAHDV